MRREALALQRKLPGSNNAALAESLHLLAKDVEDRGDLAGAEELYLELWSLVKPGSGGIELRRDTLDHLVNLYTAWSEKDAAKTPLAARWKQELAEFDKRNQRP